MKTLLLAAVVTCLAAVPAAVQGQQAAGDPIYKPGNGVTAPVAVKQVRPQYTAEAMRAKVEGTVVLECVVEKDGSVENVRVTKSLEPGLDEEAVKAARHWRFKPGTKGGKAVRVRISLEMTFTLK